MKIITEDYVSFEAAKLLKEKGFDGEVHAWYNYFATSTVEFDLGEVPDAMTPAPTLQMAMKWLRKVHKIFIDIDWDPRGFNPEPYYFLMTNMKINDYIRVKDYPISFSSYEEAAEAAIKYCLENLIK